MSERGANGLAQLVNATIPQHLFSKEDLPRETSSSSRSCEICAQHPVRAGLRACGHGESVGIERG